MIAQFQAAAEAVGTTVKRFTTLNEAGDFLKGLAAGKSIATSGLPEVLSPLLDGFSISPAQDMDRAHLGISFAAAGIAQTGSLLLELTDPAGRSATALPPVHAVFLRASTIVPDLYALHDTLAEALSPAGGRYLSIITGPSRTADIERVLTIGVHGPKELYVLLLEGE